MQIDKYLKADGQTNMQALQDAHTKFIEHLSRTLSNDLCLFQGFGLVIWKFVEPYYSQPIYSTL